MVEKSSEIKWKTGMAKLVEDEWEDSW